MEKIDFGNDQVLKPNWLNLNIFVRQLILHEISVTAIAENAFYTDHFEDLIALSFVKMKIHRIFRGTFRGLGVLQILHFKDTDIETFEDNALQEVPMLLEFIIIDCHHDFFIKNLFKSTKLIYLRNIFISNCKLNETIAATTFSGLQKLEQIYLFNNNIKLIESGAFDISTLKWLNLSSNALTSLPIDLFKLQRTIDLAVDFTDNPWHCDCVLEKAHNSLLNSPHLFSFIFGYIVCKTPPKYQGMKLVSLPPLCIEVPTGDLKVVANDASNIIHNDSSKRDAREIEQKIEGEKDNAGIDNEVEKQEERGEVDTDSEIDQTIFEKLDISNEEDSTKANIEHTEGTSSESETVALTTFINPTVAADSPTSVVQDSLNNSATSFLFILKLHYILFVHLFI